MSPEENVEWVTPNIIREIFNREQFYNKTLEGHLKTYVKRDKHPDVPPAGEPYCTRSQIVYYYDMDGNWVAIVHQYLRRDGTIGGSGRPDPKRLRYQNRIFSVQKEVKK